MQRNRLFRFALLMTFAAFAAPALSADEPRKDAKPPAASTTELRQETLKGFVYFAIKTKTNFQKIGETINAAIPELKKAVVDGKAQVAGPMIFIYHGAIADPAADFDIEIGYPILEKVADVGNFKSREVPEYPCVSVLYTGGIKGISGAYEKLFTGMAAQSIKPTDESREMILYFEGLESPNNVTHISAGVAK